MVERGVTHETADTPRCPPSPVHVEWTYSDKYLGMFPLPCPLCCLNGGLTSWLSGCGLCGIVSSTVIPPLTSPD